jgi:hypothetical protein
MDWEVVTAMMPRSKMPGGALICMAESAQKR